MFFLVKHAYNVYIAGTCFSTELQYCHQLHIKIQKRTCSQERKQNKPKHSQNTRSQSVAAMLINGGYPATSTSSLKGITHDFIQHFTFYMMI